MTLRNRNAIVIIHGIGEQKPMDTLRGFVKTMTDRSGSNPPKPNIKFYNKPDELSNLFELRRLTTSASSEEGRAKTDFYEYYWAYNNRDTKLQQVLSWFAEILFRWPWSLPKRIRPFHITLWILLIGFLVLAISGQQMPFTKDLPTKWLGIIGTIVSGFVTYILTSYVGDAARYTSANPGNIAERKKIRTEGIQLLKALHDSGEYEKIIIVGHSLGSIIGYDLIKHLWTDYSLQYKDTLYADALLEFEAKYANTENFDVNQYQLDQESLFYQQNSNGNPWRISHFITLGSPLTHAPFLLAKDLKELRERIEERELPTSPPTFEVVGDKKRFTYLPNFKQRRRVLHHASPFACTQWVNMYYGNDFVGGNVSEYFGPGIKEHKIQYQGSSLINRIPFLSHTHYWADASEDMTGCEKASIVLKEIVW